MRDFLIVLVVVHASFTSEEGIYSKTSRQSAGVNPACGAHHHIGSLPGLLLLLGGGIVIVNFEK